MTTVHHTFDRPIAEVFAVLAEPRTYPEWLIGAKEMRSVDPTWPAPGSSFHHRVGIVGRFTVADSSTCLAVRAPTLLVLEVRARPFGRARVSLRLSATAEHRTEVAFSEDPLGRARILAPLVAPLTLARNARSLDRLDQFLADATSARPPGR